MKMKRRGRPPKSGKLDIAGILRDRLRKVAPEGDDPNVFTAKRLASKKMLDCNYPKALDVARRMIKDGELKSVSFLAKNIHGVPYRCRGFKLTSKLN